MLLAKHFWRKGKHCFVQLKNRNYLDKVASEVGAFHGFLFFIFYCVSKCDALDLKILKLHLNNITTINETRTKHCVQLTNRVFLRLFVIAPLMNTFWILTSKCAVRVSNLYVYFIRLLEAKPQNLSKRFDLTTVLKLKSRKQIIFHV